MSTLYVPIQINGDLDSPNKPSKGSLLDRELYIASDGKLYYGDGLKNIAEIKPTYSHFSGISKDGVGVDDGDVIFRTNPFVYSDYLNTIGKAWGTIINKDTLTSVSGDANGKDQTDVVMSDVAYMCINKLSLKKVRKLTLHKGYMYGYMHPNNQGYLASQDLENGQLYFKIANE